MKRESLAGSIAAAGVVAGLVLAILPSAGAANRTIQGVVLAKSSARHTLAVSSTAGVVRTVHARSLRIGTRVDIVARQLHDGTFRALQVSAIGRSNVAQIRSAVVLRQTASRLVVSAGGSTLSIRTTGRTLAGLGASRLAPGSVVSATLKITSSGLSLASINRVQTPLGASGASGTSGTSGASGDEGDDQGEDCTGATGASGASGPSGQSGDDDESDDDCGASGASGASGQSGDEGDDDSGDDDSGDSGDSGDGGGD